MSSIAVDIDALAKEIAGLKGARPAPRAAGPSREGFQWRPPSDGEDEDEDEDEDDGLEFDEFDAPLTTSWAGLSAERQASPGRHCHFGGK